MPTEAVPGTRRPAVTDAERAPRLRRCLTAMYSRRLTTTLALLAALAGALAHAQQLPAPERPSGWIDKAPVASHRFMVATANPLATQAGYDILRAGGNAIDAVIAVQLVLGLVEPQSSGLGGGAFLLYHDAKTQRIALDAAFTAAEDALTQKLRGRA